MRAQADDRAAPRRLSPFRIPDSKESWENFRDGTLMPRMQAGIEGGFAAPPQETAFEVKNQISA